MSAEIISLDSITDVRPDHLGTVAISGSHGGVYPAGIASAAGLRGALFNDAGVGFDNAGVGGVIRLDAVGMAAAALDCHSCLIGSARDAAAHGVVSFVNRAARDAGVVVGMKAAEAAQRMALAEVPTKRMAAPAESSRVVRAAQRDIHLLDSASMVGAAHVDEIVITGSHGALIGGDPARALKAAAAAAVFNDAGLGKDGIGVTRLKSLDDRVIPAAAVSHRTARIGDALSMYETGVLSAVNENAYRAGGRIGLSVKAFVMAIMTDQS